MTFRHQHYNFSKAAGWTWYLQCQAVKATGDTVSDVHEDCSFGEGESPGRALTALPTALCFLATGSALSPAHSTVLSRSPRHSLGWDGAATAAAPASPLGSRQAQTQTSARIITGIISYKTTARIYFSIG